MDWHDYELIDFGAARGREGRKLERFGDFTCDRPSPAASEAKRTDPDWRADARYTGAKVADGKWKGQLPAGGATVEIPLADGQAFRMHLDLSPAGQVGLFPEQFANWRWIAKQVRRGLAARAPTPGPSPTGGGENLAALRVLNLFGYTGGSTLAAALAGAEVTHVDASKPSVALARANAAASGLADAPVRWLVEDALKYCRREVKRGAGTTA